MQNLIKNKQKEKIKLNRLIPATNEQLKTLTRVVYMIHNTINNKKYIGKTLKSFFTRYWKNKWWIHSHNNYLKNSAKKYMPINFNIYILNSNIKSLTALCKLEGYYIKKYNTLYPNGYNMTDETNQGKTFTEKMKHNMALAQAKGKIYKIKEISTGKIIKFTTLREIRKIYNIKEQNLNDLLNKKLRTIKGICLPETNTNYFYWNKNKQRIYVFLDQQNRTYKITKLTKFSQKYKCCLQSLYNLINNKSIICKGKNNLIFRLNSTNKKSKKYLTAIKKLNPKQKYKKIYLKNLITNKVHEINIPKDLNLFCRKNKIKKRDIYALTSRKQKTSKNFMLNKLNYL